MIRAKNLSTKWARQPLGEAVEFLDHLRQPVTERDRRGGPYPYYGANGQQGFIDRYLFDEPLILLAEDGGHFGDPERPIAYKVQGRYWVNNHAHVLRPKAGLDINYLLRHLEYYDVTSFVNGTTRGKLTKASASSIPILVPPIVEQRRIAAILDKAEAIRRKRRQALQLVDDFLRSVFLDMFGDPVTNSKRWDEVPLSEVSEVRSGVAKGRNFNGRQTVTVPYMRVANVQDGHIDLTEVKEIEVLPEEVEKYLLKRGDILMTEGGDPDKLGRGAVWEDQISPCIHQNHIFSVRVNRPHLEPGFLSALIASKRGKAYFLKASKQTTGIATINKTQLSQFPIFLPPWNLQEKYIAIVRKTQHASRAHTELLNDVERLFGCLTQRAFSGEL